MQQAAKHVLVLMPREGYILSRFMAAIQQLGLDATLAFDQPAEQSWLLVSLRNGEYGSLTRLAYGADPERLPALPFQIDAVVPTSEFSVQLAERLGADSGVFHNALEAVPAYRDKHQMRRRFSAAGLRQPDILARFDSLEQVDAFAWDGIEFPVIVKPVDLTSSLYVRLCHSAQEARSVYRRIFKHVQSFGGVAFSGSGLLETYVPGPEFSAECVVCDGVLKRLFVTTKFVSPLPACDEIGHLAGDPVPPAHLHAIHQAAARVIQAWGVARAVLHIEYKFFGNEVVIMEAACRIAGDFIAELVELQHDVCLERDLVAMRIGRTIEAIEAGAAAQVWHGIRFLFGASQVVADPVVEVLREVRYTRAASPGQQFGIHDRLGYQVVRSASIAALKDYLGADSETAVLRSPATSRA